MDKKKGTLKKSIFHIVTSIKYRNVLYGQLHVYNVTRQTHQNLHYFAALIF